VKNNSGRQLSGGSNIGSIGGIVVKFDSSPRELASLISQSNPKGFIFISNLIDNMAIVTNSKTTHLQGFPRKGNSDAKQHWFLCESIWREKRVTTPDTKLVDFQTTLRGRAL
jgi:hypothetical protein